MKTLILSAIILLFGITSCNTGTKQNSTSSVTGNGTEQITAKAPSATASSTEGIIDSYIKLKNALTQDDDQDAAIAGKELIASLDSFDKSSLNEAQAKEYTDIYEDAREHAAHIGANAGNIKHQREHFETLSKDVYDLVKAVGGTQKLYYVNCPMYNDNKGANWLSEIKEIQNPYLGKQMPECGTVKEELN
ncbi:DUF3347 domain-containing protein [Arcticibacter eurypsychrophilus]|uniref:DUF3347 domain-containing protein n=1 Tax=Arcticibacter eurypsychrophilus TaxID=1434752 RepID=UPI00084D290A|nr:DUF3347 domain-containing protein [Arcticibacter eurypsychrophilus]